VKKTLTFAALVAVASTIALAIGSAGDAASKTCKPGVTKYGGAPARVFCGPAAATVRKGTATFAIRGGRCDRFGSTFTVNIGTVVIGTPTKPRPEYFGITVFNAGKDGAYTGGIASVVHRGKRFSSGTASVTLKNGRTRGTFKAGRLSGSFHC
jgi:hypothetical protein